MEIRKSSRAIILNKKKQIFLFQYQFDYLVNDEAIWITPGGSLEEGESFDDALKRELYEELGIQLKQSYKQVYYRNPIYTFKSGEQIQSEERFYLIYLNEDTFLYDNWTENEKKRMLMGKWWSVEEIKLSSDKFFSEDILSIITNLSDGIMPQEPKEIA